MTTRSRSGSSIESPDASAPAFDRRHFLEGAAMVGALAATTGLARGQGAAGPSAASDASGAGRLPDGSEFARWEQPLTFTRTYYVDNTSPRADDAGPGSQARPFRTIGKAAQVLQPGERVVIAAGTYRECVRPARGGTGPTQMISYEAAPGAKVIIKGSEVLAGGWTQQSAGGRNAPGSTVWRHDLPAALFPDAYNPFALPSIMPSWSWLDTKVADMGPYLRRRGLVFADGKPLEPMEQLRELTSADLPAFPDFTQPPVSVAGMPPRRRGGPLMQEVGGSKNARFWADNDGNAIYVRLESGTPADHLIEVTTRKAAFVPMQSGTGYIRVKGLTFQHAGNVYPFPQFGLVSLGGGDHWILEDNTIEWANGAGLVIGSDGYSDGARQAGASHVVRRNTLRYCGICGLAGMGTSNTLVEDNLIEWCGWADAERGWEAAGAKFHRARNMMFRRNVVRHMRHANAVWWDVGNSNCRITSNVFADVVTVGAAVHIEMTTWQNQIDNNIIWDVRNAEPGTPGQRGCAGSGIFDNASDKLVIAQNLIGRCDNAGLFAIVRPDRAGGGTATDNIVSNNIFARCDKAAIVFLNQQNQADGNVFVKMPANFLGFFEGASLSTYDPDAWQKIRYRDLAAWRALAGWDRASVMSGAEISFNPDTLQLAFRDSKALPVVPIVNGIQVDMLGKATGTTRIAGPLADISAQNSWMVDPRHPA